MKKYIIEGGKKLEGQVSVSGSKNASLPIIAASVLNTGKTTFRQVTSTSTEALLARLSTDNPLAA